MSDALDHVKRLVAERRIRVSGHGWDRFLKHDIDYQDILAGADEAITVEEYPDYVHGPSILVLQRDAVGRALHVLWGIPKQMRDVAVVVTAYRPDDRWDRSYLKRVRK